MEIAPMTLLSENMSLCKALLFHFPMLAGENHVAESVEAFLCLHFSYLHIHAFVVDGAFDIADDAHCERQ